MASSTDIPQLPEIDHKQALEIEKSIQDLPNYIGNIEWDFVKRTGTKYAGYVVKPKQPFSEIVFGLFEIGGALGATGKIVTNSMPKKTTRLITKHFLC